MSHAIYQTKALILHIKNMRESNKMITLYTEKFGLIYVAAQSARALQSKMRFHLHKLSLVEVDVVRGRDIWRLTGIHEEQPIFEFIDSPWYPVLDRIGSFLTRLCRGEESHDALWSDLRLLYSYIFAHRNDQSDHSGNIEMIFVSRALYHLGYANDDQKYFHLENPFVDEVCSVVVHSRKEIITKINDGLTMSQL